MKKIWDWNDQDRMAHAFIAVAWDYPYYEGINEDIAIMWRQLNETTQGEIKRDYPELIGRSRTPTTGEKQ